jgi:hypothetical protein
MNPNYLKLIFAVLFILYFGSIAIEPMQGSFLDNVDLPIHEFGHLLSRPLGEFMMVAGGSLFQVIFPAVFVGYFVWQRSLYSAAIVLFWVGQSVLNVWVYASDAVVMRLVLISGFTGSEGSFHDWNYMLSALDLLSSTNTIAGVIRFGGTLVIISAGILSIYYSLYSQDTAE